MRRFIRMGALASGLLLAPLAAPALDILLSNDDGQSAAGIQALRAALCDAGHHVTLVAPATDQSGRGGSINTGALSSSSAMALTRVSSDACGVQYSLAAPTTPGRYGGTPLDSIRAGLGVVLASDPPDLIVTGLNQGQNLGQPTSNTSGTIGAALGGVFAGIPAIAGSVGVIPAESATGFPSTQAAFPLAADFMARLIDKMEAAPGPELLPHGVGMLNINFPVPYETIGGVVVTRLGKQADLDLPLFDRNAGFPPLLPGNPALPSCATLADGQACSVGVGVVFLEGPDPLFRADTDAFRQGKIGITPMDGDMTAQGFGVLSLILRVHGLAP
jgi:5'-nucleotidase